MARHSGSSNRTRRKRPQYALAVLEKRGGMKLGQQECPSYNVAGGIRVDDPALDLAVLRPLFDCPSYEGQRSFEELCFAREIVLVGRSRAVSRNRKKSDC